MHSDDQDIDVRDRERVVRAFKDKSVNDFTKLLVGKKTTTFSKRSHSVETLWLLGSIGENVGSRIQSVWHGCIAERD